MSYPQGRRILVVGGVAGGGSAAARLRRLDESAEIIIFEKGPYVSFANCGLPYYVGNVIPKEQSLLVSSAMQFKSWFDIEVRVNHTVKSINKENQTILVEDATTCITSEEHYDELIISTGSKPIVPTMDGTNLPGVFQLRDIPDSNQIKSWIDTHHAKRAVVVGGGFIGLEMAENLVKRDLHVTIVEMAPHVMPLLNDELATVLEKELVDHGVELITGNGLKSIETEGDSMCVMCDNGRRLPCDLVLLSIGVRPCSELAKEAGLNLGVRDTILVDDCMKTSVDHIYAVGDAVQVTDYVTSQPTHIPLAGPANRQGRIVADVLCGFDSHYRGTQGTSVCGVFDVCVATTGQSAAMLRRSKAFQEDEICEVCVHAPNHASYYPGASSIHLDLTFSRKDGRILGAQAVGNQGVEKRIDVIATFIQMRAHVTDVAQAELCYSPAFGSAKDIVNLAGMVAENVVRRLLEPVSWEECFRRDDVVKLDVRGAGLFNVNPLPGFVNIPLGDLRKRIGEIDKKKEVFVSCVVGRTAHTACRILIANGVNAKHLPGGWETYVLLPTKQ